MSRSLPTRASVLTLLGLLALGLTPLANAQSYPDRPIRLIEAFSGGLSSSVTHLVAEKGGQRLGQAIVAVPLPGAGGSIGLRGATNAAPDGYTLIVGGQWLSTNWALKPSDVTDPTLALQPVAPVLTVPYVIITSPKKGYTTLQQLVTDLRQRPGQLNYASPGTGTAVYLYSESLLSTVNAKAQHIAYKGGGTQLNAILSGEVDFGIMSLVSALPQIKAGKLTALAVTSDERAETIASVPTMVEAGFSDLNTTTWFAIFAPADVKADIVATLNKEIRTALETPESRELIASWGAAPMKERTPEELRKLSDSDKARWRKVVEQVGIQSEY